MRFFVTVFEFMRDFFATIFFPKSPQTIKRKKLKNIFSRLNNLPNQFLTKDLFVLPSFAKVIFSIYVEVLPIKSVFEQTFMNKDIRVANRFKDTLLQNAFSEKQQKDFQSFSYNARVCSLQKSANSSLEVIQRSLKEQNKDFVTFLHELRTPEITNVEHTLQDIYSLYDFCNFDYFGLLSYFMNLNEKNFNEIIKNGGNPNFHKVMISAIIKELLDFHFVIKNVKLENNIIRAIEKMHNKLANFFENKFLFVMQQISQLKEILQTEFEGHAILSMIRYAKREPDFDEKINQKFPHILSDFTERLEAQFLADTKKLLLLFQEDKIEKMVKDAFGNKKFFSFAGYNTEVNTRLQKVTSLSFDWIRPMELLRTFTKQNFDIGMSNFIKSILVEGLFIDNSFQKNLGAAFYYCENLSDKFEEFERLFTDGEKCSLSEINGYLKEIEAGGNFEKALLKLTEQANLSAKNIVQDAVEKYSDLYSNSVLLIADSKKHTPELISNIKVLFSSTKLRAFVSVFDNEVQKLKRFLEIMKNYAILVKIDIS